MPIGEYFGTPEQIELLRRSEALWNLLKHDRRFSYYGRTVSLAEPQADAAEISIDLARIQAAASCQFLPKDSTDDFCAVIDNAGLNAIVYELCFGEQDALVASKHTLENYSMPNDVTVVQIDHATAADVISKVAKLSIDCAVMPVSGAVMRSQKRDGICLVAIDAAGDAISTAASYFCNHPEGQHAKHAFWGSLATRPDRRGQRLGQILGAQAIAWMWENRGARGFFTGITPDNDASLALCAKLGVAISDWDAIAITNRNSFGSSSYTR